MTIQYKNSRSAITVSKSSSSTSSRGARTVSGWLSTYGPPADSYGDIVGDAAFERHLREKGSRLPALSGHDVTQMIGWHELKHVPGKGLWTDMTFLEGIARADEDLIRVKSGGMAFSIGYMTHREEVRNGYRHLLDVDLFEGSVVLMPANPLATIEQRRLSDTDQAALDQITRSLRSMVDELALKTAIAQLSKSITETTQQLAR